MLADFNFISNRRLFFGQGALERVPGIAGKFCGEDKKLLIVWGKHFSGSESARNLATGLGKEGIGFSDVVISSEPSPKIIDGIVDSFRDGNVGAVLAVGGGSVLDGGKAIAAMLCHEGGVERYLEGVGTAQPGAKSLPVIAAPTTAGTGSEATKNAVITQRVATSGRAYKKSLRHDAYVPDTVIIDPALAVGCPHRVSLACGLDAICQLLEAWLSRAATPFTDMVAMEGMRNFSLGMGLFDGGLYGSGEELVLRGHLGIAAYCSGLVLANAGLGTVHGIAGPLGAYCDVPHGVACGLLLFPVFQRIWHYFLDKGGDSVYLKKLSRAASTVLGEEGGEPESIAKFMGKLEDWASKLPRLSSYGFPESAMKLIAGESNNKSSPVNLQESDRLTILREIY